MDLAWPRLWPGDRRPHRALLVGVGFSAEAVRREQALRLGAEADFRIGDLAATGLDAGLAGAVLCVDAIHFAPRPDAAYGGIRRILAHGGRAVLTCWEPLDWDDERLPGRLRRVDLGADWPLPGSATIRWVTALAGGPVSASCGRKPRRSTPVMTRRCARFTTRACALWKPSIWSAGS